MRYKKDQKKQPEDWHQADIVAAVKKTGTSVNALSLAKGFARGTLRNCFKRTDCPQYERIIAERIGVSPAEIWPSRYQNKSVN